MTKADIKHLAAFHARYDASEKVVCCEWCKKQVPVGKSGLVPIDIDDETGMAIDEEVVCYDCLPPHDEPDVDVVE